MNVVILTGRLVRDPETKTLNTGSTITAFTMAVDRGGKSKETDFIDCKAWGKTGDFVSQYFSKGKPISIVGKVQTHTYEKDGMKRKVVDILVDSVEFVPGSTSSQPTQRDDEELIF